MQNVLFGWHFYYLAILTRRLSSQGSFPLLSKRSIFQSAQTQKEAAFQVENKLRLGNLWYDIIWSWGAINADKKGVKTQIWCETLAVEAFAKQLMGEKNVSEKNLEAKKGKRVESFQHMEHEDWNLQWWHYSLITKHGDNWIKEMDVFNVLPKKRSRVFLSSSISKCLQLYAAKNELQVYFPQTWGWGGVNSIICVPGSH